MSWFLPNGDMTPEVDAFGNHLQASANIVGGAATDAAGRGGQHFENAAERLARPLGVAAEHLAPAAAHLTTGIAVATGLNAASTFVRVVADTTAPRPRGAAQASGDRQNIQEHYGDHARDWAKSICEIGLDHITVARQNRPNHEYCIVLVGICYQTMTRVRRLGLLNDHLLSAGTRTAFLTLQDGVSALEDVLNRRGESEKPTLYIFLWFDFETPYGDAIRERIDIPAVFRRHACWFSGINSTAFPHFGLDIRSTVGTPAGGSDYIFRGPFTFDCFTGIHFFGRQTAFGLGDWRQALPHTTEGYVGASLTGLASGLADLVIAHPVHCLLVPTGVGAALSLVPGAAWRGYKLFKISYWISHDDIRWLLQNTSR